MSKRDDGCLKAVIKTDFQIENLGHSPMLEDVGVKRATVAGSGVKSRAEPGTTPPCSQGSPPADSRSGRNVQLKVLGQSVGSKTLLGCKENRRYEMGVQKIVRGVQTSNNIRKLSIEIRTFVIESN